MGTLRQNFLLAALFCAVASSLEATAQEARRDPPGNGLQSTIPTLPMLRSVEEAEREAESFPRGAEPDTLRHHFIDQYPGSGDRKCARPDPGVTAVRSGDFAIGADITRLYAGRPAKIWMIPLHDPAHDRKGLLVRAMRLDGDRAMASAQDSTRIISLAYGYPVGRPNPGAFFPSRTFTLPSSGDWLIVATSGSDWGCVILRVN